MEKWSKRRKAIDVFETLALCAIVVLDFPIGWLITSILSFGGMALALFVIRPNELDRLTVPWQVSCIALFCFIIARVSTSYFGDQGLRAFSAVFVVGAVAVKLVIEDRFRYEFDNVAQ